MFSSSKDFKIQKPPLCQKMWLSIFRQVDGLQNEQNLTFETPNFISEKMIDQKQTKDVEQTTKTSNCVSIVFEQKFGFENSKRHL